MPSALTQTSLMPLPFSPSATISGPGTISPKKMEQINASAQDFEAMFISEMVKPMIESVPVDEMFGGGKGEDVFRSFLTQEYGKKMAAAGGIGLASPVREALLKLQESANTSRVTQVESAAK